MSRRKDDNRSFTQYLTDKVLHPAGSEALQRAMKSGDLERTLGTFSPRDVSFKAVHEDGGSMFVARCFGQELYLVPEERGVDVVMKDRSGEMEALGSIAASEPLERLEGIVRAFVEGAYREAGLTDWACARGMGAGMGIHRAIL